MKVYVLWVRHCESCVNVLSHSKSRAKKLWNIKQVGLVPPNCTMIGLLQSFMFGYQLLPEILKRYPDFSKVDYYCSVLKRAKITAKMISYGFEFSGCKVKTSKEIQRLCHVSESLNKVEKTTRLKLTSKTSMKRSDKQVDDINRRYRRTGKKIAKQMQRKTKGCVKSDYDKFVKNVVPTLDHSSLNVIVSHGKFLKKHLKLKKSNNVDCFLVEYDTETGKQKVLMKVFNETDLSNDQLSHASAKKDVFDFNYSSKTLNLKTSITFHQFKQYMQSLSNLLEFSTRNNEAPCGK